MNCPLHASRAGDGPAGEIKLKNQGEESYATRRILPMIHRNLAIRAESRRNLKNLTEESNLEMLAFFSEGIPAFASWRLAGKIPTAGL